MYAVFSNINVKSGLIKIEVYSLRKPSKQVGIDLVVNVSRMKVLRLLLHHLKPLLYA